MNLIVKKTIVCAVGLLIFAIGLNMMIIADIGIGPFDSFCLVIAELTGLNFGNAQLLFQSILFVVLLLIIKKSKQTYLEVFVSLLSTFIGTRIINFTSPFVAQFADQNKYLMFIVGFVLLVVGVSVNLKVNIIINPIDKLVVALSGMTNIKVGTMKLITDVICGVLTIIFVFVFNYDVAVSVTMLFILFCTGPAINILNSLVFNKLEEKFLQ